MNVFEVFYGAAIYFFRAKLPSVCFVHEVAALPLAPDQQRLWSQAPQPQAKSSGPRGYVEA